MENIAARVLVVDDMTTNRMLIGRILTEPEYEVVEAASGEAALEYLRNNAVDVVLMDVMMPGIDGFETTQRIRGELGLPLLPVIILTTMDATEAVVLGLKAGADDYITKPFNSVELVARVQAAVARKRLIDRLDDTEAVVFSLARMVEARDHDTGDHCDRLAHAGVVLGKALQLPPDDLDALRRGGIMHDIGKLGIPDAILLKEGKLEPAEWKIMKQHATIGAGLCAPLRTMKRTLDIIRHHHEKWDGSGYPDGLAGEDIPLLARVFQIVDVYDALSFSRPYKPAFAREKVIEILNEETAKGYWDPNLMAVFMDIVKNRPQDLVRPKLSGADLSETVFGGVNSTEVWGWYHKDGHA